jgi:Cdc6-like AAA superfamily ATPase
MNTFLDWSTSLRSRLQNQLIDFPDYEPDALVEIFKRRCAMESMILLPEAEKRLVDVVEEKYRKRDSTFCNAREVDIMYSKTFINLSKRLTPLKDEKQRINEAASIDPILRTFVPQDIPDDRLSPSDDIARVLQKLNALVALDDVKKEITEFVSVVLVNKMREKKGAKPNPVSMHMVFSGNPGTGKTIVARLMGEILRGLGLLSKGHVVEVTAKDLEAGYVGQTAPKTFAKIKEALDGVLFIDEAYELTPTTSGTNNTYGEEVITTLLKEMEDKRERLAVIIAGYTKKMQEFIRSNEGLQSRFGREMVFPDYNAVELEGIFHILAQEASMVVADSARRSLTTAMVALDDNRGDSFGNGRVVRNFLGEVIKKQAARVLAAGESCDPMEIVASDLDQGLEKMLTQMNFSQSRQTGFHSLF